MVDLNEISVFARVVEAGSFSEAARQLGLPKSTVSRKVAALEEQLGVRLLQRTTRKLNLTDAGAAYYDRVAPALIAVDEANSAVTDMQEAPHGVVRVTAPVDFGTGPFAQMATDFVRSHPGMRVDVVCTNRTVDLVAEGFDLAIRAGTLSDSSLVARKLGSAKFGLVASPDYLERRGAPQHPSELAEHDCVPFRPKDGLVTWTLVGPDGETESVSVGGAVSADDFTFVRAAVRAGAGIGILPSFQAKGECELGRLVPVLPGWWQRSKGGIYVVYPSTRYLPQRVALLRDFLVARMAELLDGASDQQR